MCRKAIVLSAYFFCQLAHALDVTQTAGWYVDTYGVARESPLVRRVERIFTKVKRASDQAPIDSSLVIIDSDADSIAIALGS